MLPPPPMLALLGAFPCCLHMSFVAIADPPITTHGKVTKVGKTSMLLLERSLDEYVGYAYKFHGVEPSLDLVMQPNMFSKFMAFKLARGNAPGTMLRAAQQVSMVVPVVMCSLCPLVSTWTMGHAAQVRMWYNTLKGGYREEAKAMPAKRSLTTLAEQWEEAEASWEKFTNGLEVGDAPCCPPTPPNLAPYPPPCPTPSFHLMPPCPPHLCRWLPMCSTQSWPYKGSRVASSSFWLAGSSPLSGLGH